MKILSVVGARPNFMKIAPFIRAIEKHNNLMPGNKVDHLLVHTGQHYDSNMSGSFFKDLNIPEPDINLEIGSGSHAEQVGRTMIEFEKVLQKIRPDWVVVVGDVNATLACSVTTKKEKILLCHIEAGLRSGDLGMPEEINRLVTDRLADLLLTPDRISSENLRKEGVAESRIRFTGNIMIDTMDAGIEKAMQLDPVDIVKNNMHELSREQFGSIGKLPDYSVITLHRPSNVDEIKPLTEIIDFITNEAAGSTLPLWSLHPRTIRQLQATGLISRVTGSGRVIMLNPLDYFSMLRLNMNARIMITDSGGLQEECTVLGTPCLTLRFNTERPVTLREHGGVSVLVGNRSDLLKKEFAELLKMQRIPVRPELWDGHAAERCLEAIISYGR